LSSKVLFPSVSGIAKGRNYTIKSHAAHGQARNRNLMDHKSWNKPFSSGVNLSG
jgi:hypothetical protein